MKQVLVDMDRVLADVYAQFIRLEFEETGKKLDINSLSGKLEKDALPQYETHVRSAGFFRTPPVMPGSVDGLKILE